MLKYPLLVAWLAGCAGSGESPGGDTAGAIEAPEVSLLSPLDAATVCGTPLALALAVENFTLVGFEEEQAREGIGHVDIKLNGQNRWMSDQTEFEIPQVDEGLYLVEAVLVHEDHFPIEPYTADSVTVTVDTSACAGR